MLSLATFNVHMGVDGWGRPFDVVSECAALDADLLVLQEAWTPIDDGPGTAAAIATGLGYRIVAEASLARGRLYEPVATSSRRWSPFFGQLRMMRPAHRLDGEREGEDPAGGAGRACAGDGASHSSPGCPSTIRASSTSARCDGTRRGARW